MHNGSTHYFILTILISSAVVLASLLGGVTEIGAVWLYLTAAVIIAVQILPLLFSGQESQAIDHRFFLFWLLMSVMIVADVVIDQIGWRTPSMLAGEDAVGLSIYSMKTSLSYWSFMTSYLVIAWSVSRLPAKTCFALLIAVGLMGLVQALYGLVEVGSESVSIFGVWSRYSATTVSGTFYNPNHFTGYLELSSITLLACCLFLGRAKLVKPPIVISFVFIFIMIELVAITASRSRLGLVAIIIGLSVFWLYDYMAKEKQKGQGLLVISCVTAALAATLWFGVTPIMEKYFTLWDQGNTRTTLWSSTFSFPLSWWVSGVGPGRFVDYYPLVQPAELKSRFIYLHNDILQFILEFGFVRVTIILAVAIKLFGSSIYLKKTTVHVGVACSCLALLVHSIGDFNLQIPGVALLFWILVGSLLNPRLPDLNKMIDKVRNKPKRRTRRHRSQSQIAYGDK